MNVLGFNITTIKATREEKLKKIEDIATNVEFTGVSTESLPLLKQDEILKINFKYQIQYKPTLAEILFEGHLLLNADEETVKESIKNWKKKEVLDKLRIPLLNLILIKCNVKALELEEQLNLPFHLKLPKIANVKKD